MLYHMVKGYQINMAHIIIEFIACQGLKPWLGCIFAGSYVIHLDSKPFDLLG